jgi:hypothetical protein
MWFVGFVEDDVVVGVVVEGTNRQAGGICTIEIVT